MRGDMGASSYWLKDAPVTEAIAHMAVSMMLAMAATTIYMFTDTLFIGQLGDTDALAAVPLCIPFTSLVIAISSFFEVGVCTLVSRSIGRGDGDKARRASAFGVRCGFVAGVVLTALSLAFMDPLLTVLGANGTVRAQTAAYLSFYCLGAPIVVLNMVCSQLVRSIGRSKESMAGLVGSALANIALDPLFIFVLGFGVRGAAIATVASNGLAVAYYLFYIRKSDVLCIFNPGGGLAKHEVAEVSKVGISATLMAALMGLSSLVFNNVAIMYGAAVVAAFGIAQNVVQLLDLVAMGLYEGVVPLIGGAYGAGDRKRLKAILVRTALLILAFAAAGCVLVIAGRDTILSWFTQDGAVLEVGALILTAQVLSMVFEAGTGLITSTFQGCGKGLSANVMSIGKGIITMACIVSGNLLFGLDGVVWSLLASAGSTFLLGIVVAGLTMHGNKKPEESKGHAKQPRPSIQEKNEATAQ